jgi:hypothetical protein
MITRTPRTLLALALAASLLFAGCSDDGDDSADGGTGATTTEVTIDEGLEAWCELSREGVNVTTSEQLAAVQAQAEAAPEELKEDYEVVLELLEYRTENPADAAGIQERLDAAQAPTQRVAEALERECGFNPFALGG